MRNGVKIMAVQENARFVMEEAERRGGFGKFLAQWPAADQIGLLAYLKKHACRLGGNTAMYFLRHVGKDGFILSRDVVARLRASGLEIRENPASKMELKLIQEAFNAWHEQSGLCYTHLSQIAGYSIGENHPHNAALAAQPA